MKAPSYYKDYNFGLLGCNTPSSQHHTNLPQMGPALLMTAMLLLKLQYHKRRNVFSRLLSWNMALSYHAIQGSWLDDAYNRFEYYLHLSYAMSSLYQWVESLHFDVSLLSAQTDHQMLCIWPLRRRQQALQMLLLSNNLHRMKIDCMGARISFLKDQNGCISGRAKIFETVNRKNHSCLPI